MRGIIKRIYVSGLLPALAFTAATARADVLSFNFSNTPSVNGDTSTGLYVPLSIYSTAAGFGVDLLLPPIPLSLPLGGGGNSSLFMSTLQSTFTAASGWQFTASANNLAQDSLQVNADQAGGNFPCYQNTAINCVGIAGTAKTSGFAVSYTGAAINNGHWIQVLATNDPAAGKTSPYVDNNSNAANPYYDSVFAANSTVFLDAPDRSPVNANYYWVADLYYASGVNSAGTAMNPTQVTIYNGLVWGWANIFVSTQNVAQFKAAVDGDLTSVATLDSALDAGTNLAGVLNQMEVTDFYDEFNAAVPEPSFWFLSGALLICVGYFSRRKRGIPAS